MELPPVDVARFEGAIARGIDRLGRLWGAGRLRTLLDDDEGHEALALLERARSDLVTQWAQAVTAGQATVSMRFTGSRRGIGTMVALARRLLELMEDEASMEAVQTTPLPPEDLVLWRELTSQAEAALIAPQS